MAYNANMHFFSTRDKTLKLHASEAILLGLSPDAGLFLPSEFPLLPITELTGLDYPSLALGLLRPFLEDYSEEELKECLAKAYGTNNFPRGPFGLSFVDGFAVLELTHGPTLTFKDMALSLFPHLLEGAMKKQGKKRLHILTATSGDTGSAVLSAFASSKRIGVSVLYPEGGISYVQEKQMLSFTSPRHRAYALRSGNFDDAQTLVKQCLQNGEKEGYTSANSINIGRLFPQVVYYFAAYLELVKQGKIKLKETIDVIVPTGNFGDILAGYFAKKMGLPIRKLVIASNANRILTDFLSTGHYDLRNRPFKKTSSPSMDILISSNLERLLYLCSGDDQKVAGWMKELKENKYFAVDEKTLGKIRQDFLAGQIDEDATEAMIRSCYASARYVLDPHTAVAYGVAKKTKGLKNPLIVSTASPLKFSQTVLNALGEKTVDEKEALALLSHRYDLAIPASLQKAVDGNVPKLVLDKEGFKKVIRPLKDVHVFVHATSANLGPGFDALGLALSLGNEFVFFPSDKDEVEGYATRSQKGNLVLRAFHHYFESVGIPAPKVRIEERKKNVPLSRGLGSSAMAIVAGLSAANLFCQERLDDEELFQLATELEGHPDNVAPALFGGLCASYQGKEGRYCTFNYPVDPQIKALLYVPETRCPTEEARKALPQSYDKAEVVTTLQHLSCLLGAFRDGDLVALKTVLEDVIHVPYRKALIPDYEAVKKIADESNLPMTISGSGSTLILFYKTVAEEEAFVKAITNCPGLGRHTILKATITESGVAGEAER